MVSFLTMIINAVTTALLYALKAFFSLISWFLKSFLKVVKLFFAALPVTCIVFFLLFIVNIFLLFGGFNSIVSNIPEGTDIAQQATPVLDRGRHVTISIFAELYRWWMFNIHSYSGSVAYIALLVLTVLMFLPVVCVLLLISVFASYGNVLFIAAVVDAVLYVLMALFGKSFISQLMGRYYRMFPEAGRKHEERKYDRMMKKRNRELEAEERSRKRDKRAEFYEDEDDGSDNYDDYDDYEDPDDYYEDEDDYYEDEEEYYEDEEDYYEDEDEDYEDEDFEDDYDDPKPSRRPSPSAAFDFFAGCNSRESVDKKYKSLVKLYHPDNMDGDTAALQEINAQYTDAKKRFQ
ncbi:hypothetical protein [Butyrivibrio sp. XPD2006]|uniref:hypothetical protein n=1 Tax=Butyrivibrio sp. XPD2006 TaxID=1280668 RepID=UPI0003B4AFD2|nr:hypothetical protein [Butyrivibrio sp. XPD2006]